MTIERVRQIYGDEFKDLTDDQVLDHMRRTRDLCNALLDIALGKDLTRYKGSDYDKS